MAKVRNIQKDVPDTWEEAMQQYLWFRKAEGLRDSTIKGQKDIIRILFTRYPKAWDDPKMAILGFMAENVKPATYNIRLSYLKSFFEWCIREEIFPNNPLAGFKKRKAEGRTVKLDIEVLKELLTLPKVKTFAGLRDYGVIILTLDTGIRPKEALSLLPNDINFRSSELYIRPEVAKTKVSRTLPFSPITAKVIKDLIKSRHPAWNDGVPIFCGSEGTMLTRHSWNDRLEMYSKQLGTKIRPYDLRHNFSLQFLRNGGNALALQRTLGHSDLSMTKRYVALTEQDTREQHSIASPINVLLPQKHRMRNV